MSSILTSQEIQGLVDDELDLRTRLDVEARIETDADARSEVDALRMLRKTVRDGASYFAAPSELRATIIRQAQVHSALTAKASPKQVRLTLSDWFRRQAWLTRRPAMTMAATIALTAVSTVAILVPMVRQDALSDEVIASHVRSTLSEHLVDIASSDHHVVKPWLSSRLDFSPPVADASTGDAVFVGGRVDYLDKRPVAALVYRKGAHVIEVFVWPDKKLSDLEPRYRDDRGFQIAHWARHGMTLWAISDVNRYEFVDFVDALAVDSSH